MKYEFVPYALIADRSDLVHDRNPKFPGYSRGHFPDDIRMSLANIAMVLSKDHYYISPEEVVDAWLNVFRRDPYLGG